MALLSRCRRGAPAAVLGTLYHRRQPCGSDPYPDAAAGDFAQRALAERSYSRPAATAGGERADQKRLYPQEEGEHVELINIRKETPEEHALNRPNGIREAVIISAALLLLFFSLISPVLVILDDFRGGADDRWGCWNLFRRPASRELKRSTVCAVRRSAGACSAIRRGRSATFHSASSILSTRRIGSLT